MSYVRPPPAECEPTDCCEWGYERHHERCNIHDPERTAKVEARERALNIEAADQPSPTGCSLSSGCVGSPPLYLGDRMGWGSSPRRNVHEPKGATPRPKGATISDPS